MTIVNDDSRVVNKLEASLTDDARVRNDKLHRSKICKSNYRELDLSNDEPHLI